jgi:uncharacterized membrane protein
VVIADVVDAGEQVFDVDELMERCALDYFLPDNHSCIRAFSDAGMDTTIDPETNKDSESAAAKDAAPQEDDVADEELGAAPSPEPVLPAAKTSTKRKASEKEDGEPASPAYAHFFLLSSMSFSSSTQQAISACSSLWVRYTPR